MKKSKTVILNLFFAAFPWISAAFLCTVPDFHAHLQRGNPVAFFCVIYSIYMILFALFLHGFVFQGNSVSPWSDAVGAAGVILLHVFTIWKAVPVSLYSRLRGAVPFNFFLYEVLAILYLFNLLHHYKERRKGPA